MTKLCDGCRASNAAIYCTADMASMCVNCDLKIHGANKLASRHERVWICEVCEHAPAAVICKADAAALCSSCDNDIHSANPLASRHERVAVTPFFECPSMTKVRHVNSSSSAVVPNDNLSSLELGQDCWPALAAAAAAAAPSYGNYEGLLSNNLLDSVDSFLELGLEAGNNSNNSNNSSIDAGGCVPEPETSSFTMELFSNAGRSSSYSLSPTKSSSVAAVVPDSSSSLSDISKPYHGSNMIEFLCQFANSSCEQAPRIGREERVLRYKEKRKNRKFEKTVRYASRKAYAEIRPRVKGRFVKRSDGEQFMLSAMADSVVPSF